MAHTHKFEHCNWHAKQDYEKRIGGGTQLQLRINICKKVEFFQYFLYIIAFFLLILNWYKCVWVCVLSSIIKCTNGKRHWLCICLFVSKCICICFCMCYCTPIADYPKVPNRLKRNGRSELIEGFKNFKRIQIFEVFNQNCRMSHSAPFDPWNFSGATVTRLKVKLLHIIHACNARASHKF